jgi:hypothetical protein
MPMPKKRFFTENILRGAALKSVILDQLEISDENPGIKTNTSLKKNQTALYFGWLSCVFYFSKHKRLNKKFSVFHFGTVIQMEDVIDGHQYNYCFCSGKDSY